MSGFPTIGRALGPDPERTPRLFDALAAAEARALFFVVGAQVERRPDLVQRMAREGHIVGNHSFSHRWLPVQSTRRIENEETAQFFAETTLTQGKGGFDRKGGEP